MKVPFLRELRKNLQMLIRNSGMSAEEYAESKRVPKEILQEVLAHPERLAPELATKLMIISERLGFSVWQLLSPNLLSELNENQSPAPQEEPLFNDSDHVLARQLGRLIEDFVECDEAGRFEVTALAQELAEEHLREAGRTPTTSGAPS